MSYIPSELKLTDGTKNVELKTTLAGAELNMTNPTASLAITATRDDPANYVALNAPNVAFVTDVLSVVSASAPGVQYNLPIAQPTDNSVIEFMADGTSSFVPNGGGGGAVNAVLNTQYPTPATAGSVLVMNGGDAVSSSPSTIQIVSAPSINGLSFTPLSNPDVSATLSYNADALILDNLDNTISRDNFISIAQNIVLTTANSAITGNIELNSGGSINLTAPLGTKIDTTLRLVGPANTGFRESTLLMDESENFQISNGSGLGGNIVFSGTGNVLNNTTNGYVLKNLGQLNVDTNNGNLFTISNNAGPLRLYSDFPITTQCNTSNINFINDTGLFIKDRISDFESNIKQQDDGNFRLLNENGSILLLPQKGVDIGSTSSVFTSKITTDNIGDMLFENTNGSIDLKPSGRVKITRPSDPQLDFVNADYLTQECKIAFESGGQELIMEHHSPDLASRCNIRLGINDINIATFVGLPSPGDIHLNTGTGLTFINNYSMPNINPTADGQLLSCNIDGVSSWIDVPPATIAQNTYTYWVSTVGGSDSNNGSIINPFLTIQYAIGVANALADTIPVVINVLAGTYIENLTITRTNMTIIGGSAVSPNLTVIVGTVSFSIVSSNAITNPQVGSISNFLISNTVSQANTTLFQNTLLINNCVLFPTSDIIPLQTSNAGGSVQKPDMTVANSFIYIFNQPVTIDSTGIFLVNTQVTNSPLFSSTSSFFNVIGSGRFNAFGAILRNTNTTAQVGPLVLIANSVDSTSDSTINTTSFIYNSGTSDAGVGGGGKCGIRFSNTASVQTYIVTNSFFKCLGATTTTGSANQFLIIQRTGTGQCSLAIGNNPCQGTNTHHVPASGSGFTKIILVNAL